MLKVKYNISILFYLLIANLIFGQQKKDTSSVNIMEQINLNGENQWILVRGENLDNPILLFLHGGPGFPEMPFTHIDSRLLEKHFLVVNWDQRGAGKSFNTDIPVESISIKQYLSDALELIKTLKKRFSKEKIFLIGHSWGSILGVKLVTHFPDLFYAYIGMGQVVNMKKGEELSYNYSLAMAKNAKDTLNQRILEDIGSPVSWSGLDPYKKISAARQILTKYGGNLKNITYRDLFNYWNSSPYYTKTDKGNLMKGLPFVLNIIWKEMMEINFEENMTTFGVPVFFFAGKYDYVTPSELVLEYFKDIKAPYKEIVWFNKSGHQPNLDEPDLYQDKIIYVLKTIKELGIVEK